MKIVTKPTDQQIWVVRAQSGHHIPNFMHGKLIAIGHIDHLKIPEKEEYFPDEQELLKKMLEHVSRDDKKNKAQIQNHYNQVVRFINEMKIGDLVVCPSSDEIMVGRIIGKPYISRHALEVVTDVEKDTRVVMSSNLRRAVVWGPTLKRKELSYKVNKALTANQAVFSLNEYSNLLYHALYPCFLDGNTFHFSIKIKQQEEIDNYSVSELLAYLSEVEAASMLHKDIDLNNEAAFRTKFRQLRVEKQLQLRTKAQFMSPGDILGNVDITVTEAMLWFYIGYSAIFGSSVIGWKGVVDEETKKQIFEFFTEKWKKKDGDIVEETLQLSKPKHQTLQLEDNTLDAERQREPVIYVDLDKVFNQTQPSDKTLN